MECIFSLHIPRNSDLIGLGGGVIPVSNLLVSHCSLIEDFCIVSNRASGLLDPGANS